MRLSDIAAMALGNLWQRKLRSALNLLGIVIGCTVLLLTAAAASGVEKAVYALFDSSEFARQVQVRPDRYSSIPDPPDGKIVVEGEMSDERRERIRKALVQRWKNDQSTAVDWRITHDQVGEMKQIAHVTEVVPNSSVGCRLVGPRSEVESDNRLTGANMASRQLAKRIIAGSIPADKRDEVLVDDVLAYDLGFRSDADLQELIGQQLTITYQVSGAAYAQMYQTLSYLALQGRGSLADQAAFAKTFAQLLADLDKTSLSSEQKKEIRQLVQMSSGPGEKTGIQPETLEVTRDFRVRGVINSSEQHQTLTDLFRRWFHGTRGDLLIHHEVAMEIQSQIPERKDDYYNVMVIVDSSRNLKAVTSELESRGLHVNSALDVLDSFEYSIRQSKLYVYGIAAAILLASGIGISNTLIISVLQRTPEFGIMKAVGARDRDVLLLMLTEGAVLGVAGATLALIFSWLLSAVGEAFLARRLSGQDVSEVASDLMQFQFLPTLLIYLIAITICVGASMIPAWRASRLDPVVAMRRI